MAKNEYDTAIALAEQDVPVYPLASGTTVPLKGSHGYKDATTDIVQLAKWFNNEQHLNVGMALKPALLLVVDLDRQHASGYDGITTFNKLNKRYGNGESPLNTYVLKTPHGGIHLFYKIPAGVTIPSKPLTEFSPQLSKFTGIDVQTNGTPAALTTTAIGRYEVVTATKVNKITDAVTCPEWLLSLLTKKLVNKAVSSSYSTIGKTWTGKLLEAVFDPSADTGNRNVYLTSLCGKLVHSKAKASVAYEALLTANRRLPEPLKDTEINTIFRSVLRRELGE